MKGVQVITTDIKNNPCCAHGPTLLFSKLKDGEWRRFFACSACRDRKDCSFFLWEDEKDKHNELIWQAGASHFLVNPSELYKKFKRAKLLKDRKFCRSCNVFLGESEVHSGHNVDNVTDYMLEHPSEFLTPLDNPKKEAQYLFSKDSVRFFSDLFDKLNYSNVVCIGTPRIYERLIGEKKNAVLLDFDKRLYNFYPSGDFCLYNMFNNHFFFDEERRRFEEFLSSCKNNAAIIIDPPFGGRVEPLAQTLTDLNKLVKRISSSSCDIPIFLIYPYFNEVHILNHLPQFCMLDYKVEYDNHALFQSGPKARKQGSPVRIFTNVTPNLIQLPVNIYKFCKLCDRWVSKENKHCKFCNSCTSKSGHEYKHCSICERCVKSTWRHCEKCRKCCTSDHSCIQVEFVNHCLICKEPGHKKQDCPRGAKLFKRKKSVRENSSKKRKIVK